MMAEPPQDPPIFTLFNEIGIIEQLARQRLESVLPEGLKISHFSVLNHFARLGGERAPAELARAFQVTKAAMMVLSLTFDHRVVDGAPAAEFLQRVKALLEDPWWMVS